MRPSSAVARMLRNSTSSPSGVSIVTSGGWAMIVVSGRDPEPHSANFRTLDVPAELARGSQSALFVLRLVFKLDVVESQSHGLGHPSARLPAVRYGNYHHPLHADGEKFLLSFARLADGQLSVTDVFPRRATLRQHRRRLVVFVNENELVWCRL